MADQSSECKNPASLIRIADDEDEDEVKDDGIDSTSCDSHSDEAAVTFCKTCEEALCLKCTIGFHNDHDKAVVDDAIAEKHEEVKNLNDDLRKLLSTEKEQLKGDLASMKAVSVELSHTRKQLAGEKQTEKQQLQAKHDAEMKSLEKDYEKRLEKAVSDSKKEEAKASCILFETKSRIKELEDALKCCDGLPASPSLSEVQTVLSKAQQVQQNLTDTASSPGPDDHWADPVACPSVLSLLSLPPVRKSVDNDAAPDAFEDEERAVEYFDTVSGHDQYVSNEPQDSSRRGNRRNRDDRRERPGPFRNTTQQSQMGSIESEKSSKCDTTPQNYWYDSPSMPPSRTAKPRHHQPQASFSAGSTHSLSQVGCGATKRSSVDRSADQFSSLPQSFPKGKAFQSPTITAGKELTVHGRNTRISVYKADITNLNVDSIVSPVAQNLDGGGVASAIRKTAGTKYSNALADTKRTEVPLPHAKVVTTPGYDLGYKFIFHVRGPDGSGSRSDSREKKKLLEDTVLAVLKEADGKGVKSVAIPAIGAGQASMSAQVAAPIILKTAYNFQATSLREIHLVDFNDATVDALKRAESEIQRTGGRAN